MNQVNKYLRTVVPYLYRAAYASSNLDRRFMDEPDVIEHGLPYCLDAPTLLPTGGYGLATVIGSYAHCYRDGD